jgi:hypothetical protein
VNFDIPEFKNLGKKRGGKKIFIGSLENGKEK